MRNFLPLVAAVLAAVMTGCATAPQPVSTPAYFQTLTALHVAPATLQRIEAGRVLSFDDVMNLVQCRVPGDKIVPYLRSTRAVYNYSQPQIDQLIAAGADSTLVDYVGRAAGDFMIDAQNAQQQTELRQNAKWGKAAYENAYFTDPGYWGDAPFPYAFPGEWY